MGTKRQLLIPGLMAAAATACLLVVIVTCLGHGSEFSDWPQYYAAIKLMLEGKGALAYDPKTFAALEHSLFPDLGNRIILLYIPPFTLPLLTPLALFSPQLSAYLWTVDLTIAAALSVLILSHIYKLTPKQTLWFWTIFAISTPVVLSLGFANLCPLLLVFLTFAIWAIKIDKPVLAGLCLVCMFFKYQEVLPLLIYFFGACRWKEIKWVIIFTVAFIVLTLPFMGVESYVNYLGQMMSPVRDIVSMEPQVHTTIRGQLLRIPGLPADLVNTVSIILMLASWLYILSLGWQYRKSRKWLEIGLLIALPVGLITSLYLYSHDLILLATTAAALLASGLIEPLPKALKYLLLLGLVIFSFPIYPAMNYDFIARSNVLVNPLVIAFLGYTLGIVFLIYRSNFGRGEYD